MGASDNTIDSGLGVGFTVAGFLTNAGGCLDYSIYYSKKLVDSFPGRLAGITGYSTAFLALVLEVVAAVSDDEFGKVGVSGV